jgi:Raf kinase inhibitor-like YbhB/YbcL family protein
MAGFVLTSPSFEEGGSIPTKYSCQGQDVSPALAWSGAPGATASFALIVDDPDARGFIHWVIWGLPGGQTGSLAEATPAWNPPQGRNDFGRGGWGGPCPPSGTHHYRFTLYALAAALNLPPNVRAADVRTSMSGKILAQTILTGTYTRG